MIDGAVAVDFLNEGLVFRADQYPVDGLGKEANPVATEVDVGLLSGEEEKACLLYTSPSPRD